MKKSTVKNNQGQKISTKALRRKKRQENIILENEKNASFFQEVTLSTIKYLPGFKPLEVKSESV